MSQRPCQLPAVIASHFGVSHRPRRPGGPRSRSRRRCRSPRTHRSLGSGTTAADRPGRSRLVITPSVADLREQIARAGVGVGAGACGGRRRRRRRQCRSCRRHRLHTRPRRARGPPRARGATGTGTCASCLLPEGTRLERPSPDYRPGGANGQRGHTVPPLGLRRAEVRGFHRRMSVVGHSGSGSHRVPAAANKLGSALEQLAVLVERVCPGDAHVRRERAERRLHGRAIDARRSRSRPPRDGPRPRPPRRTRRGPVRARTDRRSRSDGSRAAGRARRRHTGMRPTPPRRRRPQGTWAGSWS